MNILNKHKIRKCNKIFENLSYISKDVNFPYFNFFFMNPIMLCYEELVICFLFLHLQYLQEIMEKSYMVLEMVKICSALEPTSFNTKRYFTQDAIPTEFFDNNVRMLKEIRIGITRTFYLE